MSKRMRISLALLLAVVGPFLVWMVMKMGFLAGDLFAGWFHESMETGSGGMLFLGIFVGGLLPILLIILGTLGLKRSTTQEQ